jgi:hypothetical protein
MRWGCQLAAGLLQQELLLLLLLLLLGLVQLVPQAQLVLLPRLPAGVQHQQQQQSNVAEAAGLDVLLGQRLLLALNLGEAAYSSAAQQQARLTALELQKVLEGLQGDVKAGA